MTIDIWGSLWLFLKPILLYVTLPCAILWCVIALVTGIVQMCRDIAQAVGNIVTKCRTLLNRGG
jgi:hypothetical protein